MNNEKQSFTSHALILGSIALITLLLLAGVSGAVPSEEWRRTYGGEGYDFGCFVQQTSDGGYIIAGTSGPYEARDSDAWLVKTDTNGAEEWNRTYGGVDKDMAYSVQQTSDGGYVLAGTTASYGTGEDGFWLIKTDANGDEEWNRTFGGEDSARGFSVQQTSDGGYILAGTTYSYGAGGHDVWLIRTDTNGDEQWNKTFGGVGTDLGESVQQTSDGGYIIAGLRDDEAGKGGAWLIKTDTNGAEMWNRTFVGNLDIAYSVQQTSDGGYILLVNSHTESPINQTSNEGHCGGVPRSAIRLIKTNTNGNIEWNMTFGGGELYTSIFNQTDEAYIRFFETSSVQQTSDGGYIFVANQPVYSNVSENYDALLIKIEG